MPTNDNAYYAQSIKQAASTADIIVRRKYMGQSILDAIEGPLHPAGLVAQDLRIASKWFREIADEIDAKVAECTRLSEVA